MAPANPLLYSTVRVIKEKETNRLVTLVPMLAPITMGIAPGMVSVPPWAATTTIEVTAEEL